MYVKHADIPIFIPVTPIGINDGFSSKNMIKKLEIKHIEKARNNAYFSDKHLRRYAHVKLPTISDIPAVTDN